MTEAWAAIIAALVAGVVAVVGSLIGVRVGRQQLKDQAQVEHEQWLRGQRQEAYAGFLAAWDSAHVALTQEVVRSTEQWEAMDENGLEITYDEDDLKHAHEAAEIAMQSVRAVQERVLLLGPEHVDQAVERMRDALQVLRDAFVDHLAPIAVPRPVVRWEGAVEAMKEARAGMLVAMRSELRSAPDPGRSVRKPMTGQECPARISS